MGTAMAYGFARPPAVSMLIFTALALGVAFPYLLLSGFPRLLRFLPKPGPWMILLKQFMGFPLLATVVWLAWVFGKQTGVDSMAVLLGLLLLAGLSAWILGTWMALHHPGHIRLTAFLVAAVIFLPSLGWVLSNVREIPQASKTESPAAADPARIAWEPFSPERLSSLVAAKKAVFIDFTADWCLSCKVNEKVALNKPEVSRRFAEKGVAALKADWTQGDSVIAQALEGYGRNSIPLYVVYAGDGSGDYRILPQVLTPSLVLESLDAAAR
jgi:thiol:disulfide interchange protein DsbD